MTGEERSPQWSDFENLPYINMIIKESHRWRPVSPLGVAHALGGRHIEFLVPPFAHKMLIRVLPQIVKSTACPCPRASTVVLSVRAMHHDSTTWKDPEHFIPERIESYSALASTYAASGKWHERDHYGYGAGRRICVPVSPSHLSFRTTLVPQQPTHKKTRSQTVAGSKKKNH